MTGKIEMPQGVKMAIGWGIGLGVLALFLLILLILFGNLSGNTGIPQTSSAISNETITLNDTGDTPASAIGVSNPSLSSVIITNSSSGLVITAANYTVVGAEITNATGDYGGEEVNVSATLNKDSEAGAGAESVILNFSKSATNTSSQFPTVGIIIGIALLLVVLIGILAFAVSKLLNLDSSGNLGQRSGGSGGSKFIGSSESSLG